MRSFAYITMKTTIIQAYHFLKTEIHQSVWEINVIQNVCSKNDLILVNIYWVSVLLGSYTKITERKLLSQMLTREQKGQQTKVMWPMKEY